MKSWIRWKKNFQTDASNLFLFILLSFPIACTSGGNQNIMESPIYTASANATTEPTAIPVGSTGFGSAVMPGGTTAPGSAAASPAFVEALPAFAGNSPTMGEKPIQAFHLVHLIDMAIRNNPAIQSARYGWEKVIEKYPQMVSLPDPTVTYSYPLQHSEQRTDMEQHKIVFMQEIPFPTKLYWQGEIAKEEAHMGKLAYEKAIRDIVAQVQTTFYEVIYLEAAIQITKQNQKILQEFVKTAELEVSKDKTPLPDLMRAQSQLAQMEYDLIRLAELKKVEIGQLNTLLNRTASEPLTLEDTSFPAAQPMPNFQAMNEYALKNQQEILAIQVEITLAENNISLAKHEYFPDLAVGFEWRQVESANQMMLPSNADNNEWMLMFGLNLPLWYPKRNARIREAKFSAQSLTAMKKDLENQLSASLQKAYYKAVNAHRLVQLHQNTLLPQAMQAMTTAEQWYRSGEGSLLGMLDAQSIVLNFSLAQARAKANYAQSLVEIAQLCGGTLPMSLFIQNKTVSIRQ